jgi:polysaccharide export outer membrane protein
MIPFRFPVFPGPSAPTVSARAALLRLLLVMAVAGMPALATAQPAAPTGLPDAAAQAPAPAPAQPAAATDAAPGTLPPVTNEPTLKLGASDAVTIQVYGRPELTTTTYVSDDGSISVPLAGKVQVGGLSPADAAQRIADAYREGQFLVNPQVTVHVVQYRSQLVSVLGEVRKPGRFPIESKTSLFDLIAEAGGVTENASDTVYLLRPDKDGQVTRYPINLQGLSDPQKPIPVLQIMGGDSVFVPRAQQFYVYGEVRQPNMYRLEPGMTVVEAITRAGGITERGSDSRIEIRRRMPNGKYKTLDAHLTDPVQPDDVIRVKERIF